MDSVINSRDKIRVFSNPEDKELLRLKKQKEILFKDLLEHCLSGLFDIEHPWLEQEDPTYQLTKERFLRSWSRENSASSRCVWVYYPWTKTVLRLPTEDVYVRLRASRNRNLITETEQKIFQSKCVGIAGMSVGSNILNMLILTSGPRRIKISDGDTISIHNTNRVMAPASEVGENKAAYFARRSLEIDPFLDITVFTEGLNQKNMDRFFEVPKLDLFIEEMDDPYLKIKSREMARRLGIPVAMATDNGDGILLDIERFDIEPMRPLFHGAIKDRELADIKEDMSFAKRLSVVADIVRLEQAAPRAQDSFQQVGTLLNTWPQLGTAAVLSGVAVAFVSRRILLGQPMPSGRYAISLEDQLVPEERLFATRRRRERHTRDVMKGFRSFQEFVSKVSAL